MRAISPDVEPAAKMTAPQPQGAFWLLLGLTLTRALGATFTLLMQRFLGPSIIGAYELAVAPYELLDNVRNFGTGPALIYERRIDRRTADIAWTINLGLAVLAAIVAELLAGPLARYYGHGEIEGIIRLLAVVYIFHAAGSVHSFLLLRNLDFRARCIPPVGQVIIAGTIGLVLTVWGAGVGALTARELVSGLAGAVLLWLTYPYVPRLRFDSAVAWRLMRYSFWVGLGLSTLFLSQNIDVLIGGHIIHSTADIGFYRTSWNLAFLVAGVGTLAAGGLVFPTLSRLSHDMDALRHTMLKAMRQLALGVLPVAALVAIIAPVLIVPLLGDKWSQYRSEFLVLSILAIYAGSRTLMLAYFEAYKAIGKPWLMPAYNLAKLVFLVPGMILGAEHGIMGLAAVYIPVELIEIPVLLILAHRILHISPQSTWEALQVPFACTAVMSLAVIGVERIAIENGAGDSLAAGLCIVVAPLAYLGCLSLFSRAVLKESWSVLYRGL